MFSYGRLERHLLSDSMTCVAATCDTTGVPCEYGAGYTCECPGTVTTPISGNPTDGEFLFSFD